MLFFENDSIKLYKSDCRDLDLEPFFNLGITSPPYNCGIAYDSINDNLPYSDYLKFSYEWLKKCFDLGLKNARLCVNIPFETKGAIDKPLIADFTKEAQRAGWAYKSLIIWNKRSGFNTAWGSWLSANAPSIYINAEAILIFYKDEWNRGCKEAKSTISRDDFMKFREGVWDIFPETSKKHPAPYPIELPHRLIQLLSFESDLIFDSFCGSGTTLLAAQNNNRRGVGVDLSENYLNLTKRRILENSQKLF